MDSRGRPRRRTLLGAAWAAPVVVVAAPTPAFAVSCPEFSVPVMPTTGTSGNGWSVVSTGVGSGGFTTFNARSGFSHLPNPTIAGATSNVGVTLVGLQTNQSYTFAFDYRFSGVTNPASVTLTLQIGPAPGGPFTTLFTASSAGLTTNPAIQTVTTPVFQPTSNGNHVLRFVIGFPAAGTGDDVAFNTPRGTCVLA